MTLALYVHVPDPLTQSQVQGRVLQGGVVVGGLQLHHHAAQEVDRLHCTACMYSLDCDLRYGYDTTTSSGNLIAATSSGASLLSFITLDFLSLVLTILHSFVNTVTRTRIRSRNHVQFLLLVCLHCDSFQHNPAEGGDTERGQAGHFTLFSSTSSSICFSSEVFSVNTSGSHFTSLTTNWSNSNVFFFLVLFVQLLFLPDFSVHLPVYDQATAQPRVDIIFDCKAVWPLDSCGVSPPPNPPYTQAQCHGRCSCSPSGPSCAAKGSPPQPPSQLQLSKPQLNPKTTP